METQINELYLNCLSRPLTIIRSIRCRIFSVKSSLYQWLFNASSCYGDELLLVMCRLLCCQPGFMLETNEKVALTHARRDTHNRDTHIVFIQLHLRSYHQSFVCELFQSFLLMNQVWRVVDSWYISFELSLYSIWYVHVYFPFNPSLFLHHLTPAMIFLFVH